MKLFNLKKAISVYSEVLNVLKQSLRKYWIDL